MTEAVEPRTRASPDCGGELRPTSSTACLPTWYVSSSHGHRIVTPDGDQRWRPYGVGHARQVGSSRTACGIGALGWELFWDMPFPTRAGSICGACLAEIVRSWAVSQAPIEREHEPSASPALADHRQWPSERQSA
jgi:hypothetical protein